MDLPKRLFNNLQSKEIAKIFVLYVSTLSEKASPFILGAVCKTWRELAWETPQVWSFFVIVRSKARSESSLATCVQLATEWLDRSKNDPLSIRFCTTPLENRTPGISQFHPFIDLLNQYCHRWQTLFLNIPSSLFARFNLSGASSLLLNVDFAITEINYNPTSTTKLQGLPSHVNATHCSTTHLPVDQILNILRLCPNLRKCEFGHVPGREIDLPGDAYGAYGTIVTHTVLESLEISLEVSDFNRFFDSITLEALQHLSFNAAYDTGPQYFQPARLIAFLSRSSSGLKSLTLREVDFGPDNMFRILESAPLISIEMLHIESGWVNELGTFLDRFYYALSRHDPNNSNYSARFTWQPILPRLRTFSWGGNGFFKWAFIPHFFAQISQEGDCRPLGEFIVHCRCSRYDPIPSIDEDVLEGIDRFADEVKIELKVDLGDEVVDLWAEHMIVRANKLREKAKSEKKTKGQIITEEEVVYEEDNSQEEDESAEEDYSDKEGDDNKEESGEEDDEEDDEDDEDDRRNDSDEEENADVVEYFPFVLVQNLTGDTYLTYQ